MWKEQQFNKNSSSSRSEDMFLIDRQRWYFFYRVLLSLHTWYFSLVNCPSTLFEGFLSLHSPFPCITTFHLYVLRELLGCLSYQDPSGGGRKSYELWSHCSKFISLLMQLVRLVQSIECRGGRCLLHETSFLHLCTSCTFPLPSIPLSLGFSRVPIAIWLFNSPRVGVVLRVYMPLFT